MTEDFSLGLKLHLAGWKSLYYNYVYVYGLGPESLSGYFIQQMRWALGTLGLFNKMVLKLIRHLRSLNVGQWWEYSLSGSYYWVGWANFILIICPIASLLFGIKPLISNPVTYIAAFLPYNIFSMTNFYFSMSRRGNPPRSILIGQSLGFITFWILMTAAIMALFNIRRPFRVTPKGAGSKLPLKYLLPHIVLIVASVAAIGVGVYKVSHGCGLATTINIMWAAYNALMLSMVFYFNRLFKIYEPGSLYVKVPIV